MFPLCRCLPNAYLYAETVICKTIWENFTAKTFFFCLENRFEFSKHQNPIEKENQQCIIHSYRMIHDFLSIHSMFYIDTFCLYACVITVGIYSEKKVRVWTSNKKQQQQKKSEKKNKSTKRKILNIFLSTAAKWMYICHINSHAARGVVVIYVLIMFSGNRIYIYLYNVYPQFFL